MAPIRVCFNCADTLYSSTGNSRRAFFRVFLGAPAVIRAMLEQIPVPLHEILLLIGILG
jgi:hypothetical protein